MHAQHNVQSIDIIFVQFLFYLHFKFLTSEFQEGNCALNQTFPPIVRIPYVTQSHNATMVTIV